MHVLIFIVILLLKTLYESSTALGFKKSNTIEQGKETLIIKIENLVQRKSKLQQEV